MHRYLLSLFDVLFPPRCIGADCDARGAWMCERCLARVHPLPPAACPVCGLPSRPRYRYRSHQMPPRAAGATSGESLDSPTSVCERCRSLPPPFAATAAAGVYAGVLRRAIHAYKFGRRLAVAPQMARLTANAVRLRLAGTLVVPVPSHRDRVSERGFDHGAHLAQLVANELQLQAFPGALERIRYTRPQVGLTARQRAANVRGAFSCSSRVDGSNVVLVDDVMTTGATAGECSKCLLAAGAIQVEVCVVARALEPYYAKSRAEALSQP
jgi:ComF family protein